MFMLSFLRKRESYHLKSSQTFVIACKTNVWYDVGMLNGWRDEMAEANLKRCPFCGFKVEWEYAEVGDDGFAESDGTGRVRCYRCHVSMFGYNREHTEKRWNERVDDQDILIDRDRRRDRD